MRVSTGRRRRTDNRLFQTFPCPSPEAERIPAAINNPADRAKNAASDLLFLFFLLHFFIPAPLFYDLHAKIAAVVAAPQCFRSMPGELRVKPVIGDIVAVAKAAAQLRTAVFCADVVIRTFRHVNAPYTVADLQLLCGKARRRTEDAPR